MKKLTNSMLENSEVIIKKDDLGIVLEHFDNQIELTIDKYGKVWNEGGQYVADLEDEKKLNMKEIKSIIEGICEEKGYEDSPAYVLFENATDPDEIENILDAYNQ